nr:hypothetical protein Q903MT_gene2256 [Picea sitchensis]
MLRLAFNMLRLTIHYALRFQYVTPSFQYATPYNTLRLTFLFIIH